MLGQLKRFAENGKSITGPPRDDEVEKKRLFRYYMKRFERGDMTMLGKIVNWFLSYGRIEAIPYPFVFDTPLLPTICALFSSKTLDSEKQVLSMIRIVEFLSAAEDLDEFFYSDDFFTLIMEYLSSTTNNLIMKHCLIIIGQILSRFESDLAWDLSPLLSTLTEHCFASEYNQVASISVYIVALLIAVLPEKEDLVDLILEKWSAEEDESFLLTRCILKGIQKVIVHSPEAMELAISKLIDPCIEVCDRDFPVLLEAVRCLTIIAQENFDSVYATPIIEIISAAEIISPETDDLTLFEACTELIAAYTNPNGYAKLKEHQIMEKYCEVACNGSFEAKALAMGLIGSFIAEGNTDCMDTVIECEFFTSIMSMIDSCPPDLRLILLQNMCQMFTRYPQSIQQAIDAGLFDLLDDYVTEGSPEIMEAAEAVLAMMDGE